jgi:four helix bundle protein
MKNFKGLKVWEKGMEIARKSFLFVRTFPTDQKFGLGQQITRSAVSIPSNIAEGSGRKTEKDYYHFISIAQGSAFEMETQVLIAEAINYGDPSLRKELLEDLRNEQSMLAGFLRKLSTS